MHVLGICLTEAAAFNDFCFERLYLKQQIQVHAHNTHTYMLKEHMYGVLVVSK